MRARDRGQMVHQGLNKWLIRAYLGTRNGKRQYASKVVRGTTSQARQELTAMLGKLDTHTYVEPSKLLLRDFLDAWLKSKIDVTASTREGYSKQLSYFTALPSLADKDKPSGVKPAPEPAAHQIGHLRLSEVDTAAVQRVFAHMIQRGLSRRTVEYARAVLHAAFESAVQQNIVFRNPVDHTKLPPRLRKAPSVLSMAQVDLFLEATKLDPLAVLWRLLLTSGLRPQEALALKWSDLDLAEKWVSVRRVLRDVGKGRYELVEDTKTDGSTRRIGLPESTVEALKAHKKRQSAEILLAGPKFERQDLVFCSDRGRTLDPSAVRKAWKDALTQAKLPLIRLYNARHTHFTALLQAGADISWIKDRAGHSNIQTTIQHYAHVMPEAHREMGDMTEKMLKKAQGQG